MKTILEKLDLPIFEMSLFGFEFVITSVRDDKIVFLLSCNNLERVWEFTNTIPDMKDEILKVVRNTEAVQSRITIPAFLWDLYVVVLHDLTDSPPFDELEINRIERDRFIARKIIIEYKDETDLLQKFIWNIRPEIELDRILTESGPELDELKNAQQILENVEGIETLKEEAQYKNIINYLIDIQNKIGLDQ